jgi:tetratricopeptide (TPR) repeat protein
MIACRFAEAFLCLSGLSKHQHPAIFFDLALCCAQAGDYPAAIEQLEKALACAKGLPERLPAPNANTRTYSALRKTQIADRSYLSPMDYDFPLMFCEDAKQDIIMATVHMYTQCGRRADAKRLSAALNGDVFSIFKKIYDL